MHWWVWLIIAIGLGIIEVSTITFVLLWIAIAGLITAILTPFISNVWIQLLIFAVISVVLYMVTRPLARKWRGQRKYTNQIEGMRRKQGVVVKGAKVGDLATVKVDGETWSAHCDVELFEGDQVVVTQAVSTVLSVEPTERKMNE